MTSRRERSAAHGADAGPRGPHGAGRGHLLDQGDQVGRPVRLREERVGAGVVGLVAVSVVATIGRLLDEMVEAYRAGRTEEAMEIAAESYLENYEVIEAAVIANAPDINAELEPLLAAEMRLTMREAKPVGELETKVARAKELLAQALAKIPAEGH